ncbi:MAG: class I adenylate-forming enzyme family protein [Alphaproteobacteria bacterium]
MAVAQNPWAQSLRRFAAFGERVAVSSRGQTLTYAELVAQAAAVRAAVVAAGAQPGDVIAIVARNGPGVVAASYGVMASGAAEFVVDLNLGPDDIAYAMRILAVRCALVECSELPRVASLGLDVMVLEDILARPPRIAPELPFDPHAWGKASMTSGTTGRPKGIIHRHDRRWIAHELLRAHLPFVPGANDRVLLMNAWSHGVALLAATWFETGASVELIGGVDVAYVDELFPRGELTAVFAPPTVLTKLVEGTRHKRIDGIKCIFCGTATLQPALYRAATAKFGEVIRVTYGKSEMFNPITVLEMNEAADYYRDLVTLDAVCLGTAARGVEIEIRDEAGRLCATGEHGEIHLRSPHMMHGHVDEKGFHEMPDGAFHATGDLGYLDEHGRLFLAGRAHDVMKTGGYKIYPEEIERVLPSGMVVVGIPSAHWGEIIVAVSEDGADHSEAVAAATQGLARYKHPRACLTITQIPRSLQGKVQRARVREMVLARYALTDGPYPRFDPR